MALINRITRLFRADLHAVLDRIEEPDLLLRQAIREMEAAFAEDEQRSRLLQHELAQLSGQQQSCHGKLAAMDEELDICFQSDQESLTKQLMRKKLELERFSEQLEGRRQTLQQALTELSRRLSDNRTRLEGLRQKAQLLEPQPGDSRAQDRREPAGIHISDADVEIALLREKRKRSHS
ncbi:PspA/IM30 family protein [Sedimenticola hydrogenitrophicus]|uniref:PspA/IM30 family protein n=1 Tax=Sedimenticola hydrogenitrophicus TaxID=2967975 RepID=UPI0021A853C1|nr:PspA/IM30 family protein [Sedimenticola hydrogenitrophicus]